jgi:hypothetical protein
MCGLKQDRDAGIVIAGHAFIQNVRRDHYELAVKAPANRRVAVAFDELALAIRSADTSGASACRRFAQHNCETARAVWRDRWDPSPGSSQRRDVLPDSHPVVSGRRSPAR